MDEKEREQLEDEEQPQEDDDLDESSVEEEESEESEGSESEEKPKEDEEHIDYHTPQTPERSEKEKAEFTLRSVAERVKALGGDPNELLGDKKEQSEFVTKRDLAETEARKLARSDQEFNAIMAWYDKGLPLDDAHLLANKARVKSVFSEVERGSVRAREATGAGEKKQSPNAPDPNPTILSQWQRSGLTWDPVKKVAKGKYNEAYWNGKTWAMRKI